MAYSDFSLARARKELGLVVEYVELFPTLDPAPIPSWLTETLRRYGAFPLVSEKARGELIVMPILAAARELSPRAFTVFSGQTLNVDEARGLNGECDFIVGLTPPTPLLTAPLITIVEAKNGVIEQGLGQCAAQMVGARLFNQAEEKQELPVFGCVTSGEDWQFLKLEGTQLKLDSQRYYISNPDRILAILNAIVATARP
jgi:hypothetical protein